MTAAPGHGPVHQLGSEWTRGVDGVLFRHAARVVLLDEDDRVLLLHGCDVDQRERTWWFTVGGGLEGDESPAQGAVRELAEETGIELTPDQLVGPVFTRSAVFDFWREHCRQDELFFLGRRPSSEVPLSQTALSRARWTAIELDTIDELRWWSLPDLAQTSDDVFPVGLAELVRPLLAGWDGITRAIE